VDHKSFPGGASHWSAKAAEFAPQLAAYAYALTAAGKQVLGHFIHFPIGAGFAQLRFQK
jgi:hypothetical protein